MITIHHKELLGGTVHAYTSPDVEGLFVTGPTRGAAYSELLATLRAKGIHDGVVETVALNDAPLRRTFGDGRGTSFEDFLHEQGIHEEVDTEARRRVSAWLDSQGEGAARLPA